jgi:hypothetical protein
MRYVTKNGKRYVNRQGKLIEIVTDELGAGSKKTPRKAFKTEWAKFPQQWADALRQAKSTATTYELAISILFEAFRCKHLGKEIVLSSETTGMPRNTRRKATRKLVKLGLIKLHRQSGNQAYRVSIIIY